MAPRSILGKNPKNWKCTAEKIIAEIQMAAWRDIPAAANDLCSPPRKKDSSPIPVRTPTTSTPTSIAPKEEQSRIRALMPALASSHCRRVVSNPDIEAGRCICEFHHIIWFIAGRDMANRMKMPIMARQSGEVDIPVKRQGSGVVSLAVSHVGNRKATMA